MNQLEFQEKISSIEKPIIIDFWASWCTPCMTTKPILNKLAREFSNEVEFIPINADDSREVLEQFNIFGIPTVITLRNGREVGRVSGSQTEANYRSMFEALATGKVVKIPLTPFDRTLRIGGGMLFIMIGISTNNWLLGGIGAILAFLGFYDRCPIWNAVTGMFKRK